MKTFQTYYPYDRLALVVDENDHHVIQLVWLTSRWGVYSYSGNKWNEEKKQPYQSLLGTKKPKKDSYLVSSLQY